MAGSRKTRAGGRRHFDEVANEATAAEQGNTTMAQQGMATRGEPLRGQASGHFLWQHRPVICHSSACASLFPHWQGQGAVRERVESTATDRPIPALGRSSRRPVPPSQSHGICPPTLDPWHQPQLDRLTQLGRVGNFLGSWMRKRALAQTSSPSSEMHFRVSACPAVAFAALAAADETATLSCTLAKLVTCGPRSGHAVWACSPSPPRLAPLGAFCRGRMLRLPHRVLVLPPALHPPTTQLTLVGSHMPSMAMLQRHPSPVARGVVSALVLWC